MPRTHGYSKRGERCHGVHDWNAKGRTNVIGAMLAGSLLTICLFLCNIDSDVFFKWLVDDLIPKLPSSSVVVMDNASFHKRQDMREEIEKAGHILIFLPPYSPDFNPIEHKWAQAKTIRRRENCDVEALFQDFDI